MFSSAAARVPVLDTARLTLAGHTREDVADSTAMWGDPLVTRYIGGRPLTAEEVWARILRYAGLWALLDFGFWVVRERSSGRFVGEVGLADFQREMTPPLAGVPETGWVLATWAHGHGFATEAVRAALAWADAQTAHPALGAGRTACLIAPENAASTHVAQKCGFGPAGTATYLGRPTLLFTRSRDDVSPEPQA